MKKFNNYWPVYKNLEEETLHLSKYIQFSDDQLTVYSMHIADLIMRIAVEIEDISKELYKDNNGPELLDENGNPRNLFFDTDCIQYLNDKWSICNREILVSCPNFYLIQEQNTIIKPLKKANKRGTSGAKWNKAYQAIKHDRRNNLTKGNIGILIQALGALYILNIYYRNDVFQYGTIEKPDNFFDNRLGSSIFAATFADASKASIGLDDSDSSIPIDEREKMDSALCIIKYTDNARKNLHNKFNEYNTSLISKIVTSPEFNKKFQERMIGNENNINTIIPSIIQELQIDYIKQNPPSSFARSILKGQIEIVLNKGQSVYMSKE